MGGGMGMRQRPSLIEGRSSIDWVIAGVRYTPALLIDSAGPRTLGPLALEDVGAPHLPQGADLLLLGTGPTLRRAPPALVETARAQGLRIETMDSGAAARTFNLLVQEERPIAVLLL